MTFTSTSAARGVVEDPTGNIMGLEQLVSIELQNPSVNRSCCVGWALPTALQQHSHSGQCPSYALKKKHYFAANNAKFAKIIFMLLTIIGALCVLRG